MILLTMTLKRTPLLMKNSSSRRIGLTNKMKEDAKMLVRTDKHCVNASSVYYRRMGKISGYAGLYNGTHMEAMGVRGFPAALSPYCLRFGGGLAILLGVPSPAPLRFHRWFLRC